MTLPRFLSVLLVLAVAFCAAPQPLFAQSTWAPAGGEPQYQVFGGYSAYRTGGSINGSKLPDFTTGWASQFILNTSSWTGFVVDLNGHYNDSASAHEVAFGLRFQHRTRRLVPFGEALVGVQHLSPEGFPSQNKPVYIFGAGLDVSFNSRIAFRPVQLSYVNTNYSAATPSSQPRNSFNGARVQAGFIYSFGLPSQEGNVRAVCDAKVAAVDSGDSVRVSVTTKGFQPRRTLRYSYESLGGAVTGNQEIATVDTTGTQPGSYAVVVKVADDAKGKHHQAARCQATFTVNARRMPPSAAVPPPVEATAPATAPEETNAPATAQPPADAEVRANTTGQASKYGRIGFNRDVRRPTRVDNEAKAELDRYADALAAFPDAKSVVVGYATASENAAKKGRRTSQRFAAGRAVNTKDYLAKGKGIDLARIEPRTGRGNGKRVELWIVPNGAKFPAKGTRAIDESKVKAVPRVALKLRKVHSDAGKNVHKGHRVGTKQNRMPPPRLVQ